MIPRGSPGSMWLLVWENGNGRAWNRYDTIQVMGLGISWGLGVLVNGHQQSQFGKHGVAKVKAI